MLFQLTLNVISIDTGWWEER